MNLLHRIIMISVTIQQSEICTGSKGTQQDNTPSKWAQEKMQFI